MRSDPVFFFSCRFSLSITTRTVTERLPPYILIQTRETRKIRKFGWEKKTPSDNIGPYTNPSIVRPKALTRPKNKKRSSSIQLRGGHSNTFLVLNRTHEGPKKQVSPDVFTPYVLLVTMVEKFLPNRHHG